MDDEKTEGRHKGSSIFCCGYRYSQNNEYKGKIILRCVLYNKDCSGTAFIVVGKFLTYEEHTHPNRFAKMEEKQARMKNESKTSTLPPGDNKNKVNSYRVEYSMGCGI